MYNARPRRENGELPGLRPISECEGGGNTTFPFHRAPVERQRSAVHHDSVTSQDPCPSGTSGTIRQPGPIRASPAETPGLPSVVCCAHASRTAGAAPAQRLQHAQFGLWILLHTIVWWKRIEHLKGKHPIPKRAPIVLLQPLAPMCPHRKRGTVAVQNGWQICARTDQGTILLPVPHSEEPETGEAHLAVRRCDSPPRSE